MNDTIVAQITPPGRGGVGILRISGLKAKEVAMLLLGKLPKPRYADYLSFKDANGCILDQGIAIWFPAPNSFTGEDVLELHGHGGQIVLDLLLKQVLLLPDIRIARPGEFSERAFINNKIDLTQAEAIIDLIDASSEEAARHAIKSLQGGFSKSIKNLVEKLIQLRTIIEANINFSDDELDLLSNNEQLQINFDQIKNDLDNIRAQVNYGAKLRDGMKIVITGPTNAGKSSLMNTLAGRDIAIVTNIAGTTRDILSENIYIDGIPINIVDTAGLNNAPKDKVEEIGIKRAHQELKYADHILFMIDGSITKDLDIMHTPHFPLILSLPDNIPVTIIRNKIDLTKEKPSILNINGYSVICLSTHTGHGIDILYNYLKQKIGFYNNADGIFLARRRHIQALEDASNYLSHAKSKLGSPLIITELLAEDLLFAQQALSEITGQFTSEDLLHRIFSDFCIGK